MCDVRSHKTLRLFEFTCSEHILTFGKLGKLTFAREREYTELGLGTLQGAYATTSTTAARTLQICIFNTDSKSFARLASACLIFVHFVAVLMVELQRAAHTSEPPWVCLLYTSPSPRDGLLSRMPSSA